MRIRYTAEAIADLERLRAFVESRNPPAARRIATALLDGIGNLARFPDLGLPVSRAPVPRLVRDLFVGDYTVRYLRDENLVIILRIWHGKESKQDS